MCRYQRQVKRLRFYSLFIIFICFAETGFCQEAHRVAMEQTMSEFLVQITDNAYDSTKEGKENLWGANISLMGYLKNMCEMRPHIIADEFHTVGDIDGNMHGINILTSENKKLRIYCWDTWTSLGMHRFNSLVQYKIGEHIELMPWADITEKRGKMGNVHDCYSEINTVYDKNEDPIYLVMSFSINEGNEGGHELKAYTIDSALRPIAVFNFYGDRKTTLKVSRDKAIRGQWTEDDTNIKISPDGQSIYVPVVRNTNAKRPEQNKKNYHVYQFNGTEFVYKENLNN